MRCYFLGSGQLETGKFYFLKDEYFDRFNDPKLMKGHGNEHSRPCYYSLNDVEHPSIHWLVPISHRIGKFHRIYEHKIENGNRCDTIVFGNVLGYERAFLIQNICPATQDYIGSIYSNNDVDVELSGPLKRELEIKSKRVLSLVKYRNLNLIYPDVFSIYAELLNGLNDTNLE